jgi:hypothetical protein
VVAAVLLCHAAPTVGQIPEHCKNGTLSYDISFIGPLRTIKVGGFAGLRAVGGGGGEGAPSSGTEGCDFWRLTKLRSGVRLQLPAKPPLSSSCRHAHGRPWATRIPAAPPARPARAAAAAMKQAVPDPRPCVGVAPGL